MGLKPLSNPAGQALSGQLGSWHANLIYIDRRKTVLFVNDKTLFNFIAPDVPRAQVRELSTLFAFWLSCVLSDEGFGESAKAKILGEYKDVLCAPTNNRQVLGSMNDLAFHYKHFVIESGGIHSPAVPGIIRKLNRMPFAAIGYRFPIELLRNLYETAT
jgi:hypothetical protein